MLDCLAKIADDIAAANLLVSVCLNILSDAKHIALLRLGSFMALRTALTSSKSSTSVWTGLPQSSRKRIIQHCYNQINQITWFAINTNDTKPQHQHNMASVLFDAAMAIIEMDPIYHFWFHLPRLVPRMLDDLLVAMCCSNSPLSQQQRFRVLCFFYCFMKKVHQKQDDGMMMIPETEAALMSIDRYATLAGQMRSHLDRAKKEYEHGLCLINTANEI
jgi:hypothetical protein